ncbi:hypothetical protein FPQ14_11535 [Gilliamella apicola]|uniref:Uncharacterized protein n=1 Tax=Gilliamella apicola TaxID=1196095 RepID=A0A556RGF6_9GAMM|nr:hypothetical protein [Gilliamella apicola]TSJ87967.1 hypothetical protein FPQ14_11535 [Gilliamella apicola]
MLDMETLENAGLTPEEKLQLVLMMGLFWGFDNHIKSKTGRHDENAISKMRTAELLTAIFIKMENYSKEQIADALKKCADTTLEIIDKYTKSINGNLTVLENETNTIS